MGAQWGSCHHGHILIPLPSPVLPWQELKQPPHYTETFIVGKGEPELGQGDKGCSTLGGTGATGGLWSVRPRRHQSLVPAHAWLLL